MDGPVTSHEEIRRCLSRLMDAYPDRTLGKDAVAGMLRTWPEQLDKYSPTILRQACDRAVSVHTDRFPSLGAFKKLADEAIENQKAGEQKARLDGKSGGAELRNEAIMLLADFDLVMRRTLDAEAYAYVLGECAAWWQGYRPEGGIEELDKQHRRLSVGRALEDFVRARLGMPPLPAIEMTTLPWAGRPKPQRGAGGPRTLREILNREPPAEAAAE